MRQYALKESPDVWINVPTLASEMSELWAFIAEFMYGYYTSSKVLCSDDWQKYLDDEWELEEFQGSMGTQLTLEQYFGTKENAKKNVDEVTKECLDEALNGLEFAIMRGSVLARIQPIIQYHQPNSYTAPKNQYWEELPVITDWYGMNDDFWQRFFPGYYCGQNMSDEGYLSQYVNGEMDLEDTEDAVSAEYWEVLEDMDIVKAKLRELRYTLTCSALEYFYESVQNGEIQIRTI